MEDTSRPGNEDERITVPHEPHSADPAQLQALQHQRSGHFQEWSILVCRGLAKRDGRLVALARAYQESVPDSHTIADKRPVAADFDSIALTGALYGLGQGIELALGDVPAASYHESIRLWLGRHRCDLF